MPTLEDRLEMPLDSVITTDWKPARQPGKGAGKSSGGKKKKKAQNPGKGKGLGSGKGSGRGKGRSDNGGIWGGKGMGNRIGRRRKAAQGAGLSMFGRLQKGRGKGDGGIAGGRLRKGMSSARKALRVRRGGGVIKQLKDRRIMASGQGRRRTNGQATQSWGKGGDAFAKARRGVAAKGAGKGKGKGKDRRPSLPALGWEQPKGGGKDWSRSDKDFWDHDMYNGPAPKRRRSNDAEDRWYGGKGKGKGGPRGKGADLWDGDFGGAQESEGAPVELSADDRRIMRKITIVAQLDKVPKPPPAMRGMPLGRGARTNGGGGPLSSRFGANYRR